MHGVLEDTGLQPTPRLLIDQQSKEEDRVAGIATDKPS
jgi:hypothetical protein